MSNRNIKQDVIEGLKSLRLHKLLHIVYRLRYNKPSLAGVPRSLSEHKERQVLA